MCSTDYSLLKGSFIFLFNYASVQNILFSRPPPPPPKVYKNLHLYDVKNEHFNLISNIFTVKLENMEVVQGKKSSFFKSVHGSCRPLPPSPKEYVLYTRIIEEKNEGPLNQFTALEHTCPTQL